MAEKNMIITENGAAKDKSDRRILRSKKMIQNAFLELMREKEYDSITVTDISNKAEVNRKTFYAHYETKDQLYRSMLYSMFYELFSIFIYEKQDPGMEKYHDILAADVVRFFQKVEQDREAIEVLITSQTAGISYQIGEQVVMELIEKIHVLQDQKKGQIPAEIFKIRILSFFFVTMDWWLDQTEYSVETAAVFYAKMMKKNLASIFRYQRM